MKQVCIRCLHKIKTPEMCAIRGCHNFDGEVKTNTEFVSEKRIKSKWPIWTLDSIEDDSLRIEVSHFHSVTGYFDALVTYIRDKENMPGNFGKYLTEDQYYAWNFKNDLSSDEYKVWTIPACGTDYYHRTGTAGAVISLDWSSDSGFSFDIDS